MIDLDPLLLLIWILMMIIGIYCIFILMCLNSISGSEDTANLETQLKELYQHISAFQPEGIDLFPELKGFIPEYIPAIGDIDPMIKVNTFFLFVVVVINNVCRFQRQRNFQKVNNQLHHLNCLVWDLWCWMNRLLNKVILPVINKNHK